MKWETKWDGRHVRIELKTTGGWPGLAIIGGVEHYTVEIDNTIIIEHKISQFSSVLGGLTGKKTILTGTFDDEKNKPHNITVEFPWTMPYCLMTIDAKEPLSVPVTEPG